MVTKDLEMHMDMERIRLHKNAPCKYVQGEKRYNSTISAFSMAV